MSLLDHPDAQAPLADAVLTPEAVRGCEGRLAASLERYPPRCRRAEQRATAAPVLRGLLRGLQCKTCEPIAVEAGVHREPIQFLVGAGKGDDEAVMAEPRRHVAEAPGDDRAVIVVDATTFPKSGADSCGVARQWCGRPGEQESCQVGVFLADAAPGGSAPLGRRLYRPEDWALDADRREKCHVPAGVDFREGWRIAADLLGRSREGLPHGGVVGDDEFGRPARCRAWLRGHHERSVLDVPRDTRVRDLECRRPRRKRAGRGRRPEVPFRRVDAWAARPPEGRWTRLTARAGERGPMRVDAMTVRVRTGLDQRLGPEERPVVMRTVEAEPETHSARSDAGPEVPPEEPVRVRFTRHEVAEVFEAAEREAGLAHDEVRSWVGWHHQVASSLLALWFLCGERRRVGGENPGGDGVAGARGLHAATPRPGPEPRADRRRGHAGAVAEGVGADLRVAQGHRHVPAAATAARYQLIS
jgi:hypothetical protein